MYTFIFKGCHTLGNLIVSEAMEDSQRHPENIVSYMVPHSLNDNVHITVQATTEEDARSLIRRACERVASKLSTIMLTDPIAPHPTNVSLRTGQIVADCDIR